MGDLEDNNPALSWEGASNRLSIRIKSLELHLYAEQVN